MSITRYHAELTKVDKDKNEFIIYPKTTMFDVYTNSSSNVNIAGKVIYFTECSTDWNVKQKTVTIPGFVLEDGVHVSIRFTATNSAFVSNTSWTLQINNGQSYQLNMNNTNTSNNTSLVKCGDIFTFVFSKTRNQFIRSYTQPYIPVEMSSTANSSRIYITGIPNVSYLTPGTYTNSDGVVVRSSIYIEKDTIYAGAFSGDGKNITGISASNITSGSFSGSLLPDIANLTPASYGPPSSTELKHGGSFVIPCMNVDSKGRITSIKNQSITLPTDDNNKVQVTKLTSETSDYNLVMVSSDVSSGATTTLAYTSPLRYNPSNKKMTLDGDLNMGGKISTEGIQLLNSGGVKVATLTETTFTGQSATVASISEHISATINSSSKAYPTSSGIALENSVNSLKTSKQNTITGAASSVVSNNLTANRVVVSDASGKLSVSSIDTTKLGYLSTITSNIQTQLTNLSNNKQNTITGAASSVVSNNLTANRAVVSDASGKLSVSSITNTELSYLSGVTSNIQTQLTTLTNFKNVVGHISSNTYETDAQPANKEFWVTKCGITIDPGVYIIKVGVHGRWESSKVTLAIGESSDNLTSVSMMSGEKSEFPDNNKDIYHTMSHVGIVKLKTRTSLCPYFTTNASESYTASNKHSYSFRITAVRIA